MFAFTKLMQAMMAGGSAAYTIAKSLRFRSSASAFLSRTFAADVPTFTLSVWCKRGNFTTGVNQQIIASSRLASVSSNILSFSSADSLYFEAYNTAIFTSTAVFRDPAAWYHVVLQVTQSGTAYGYVNGVQVASGAVGSLSALFKTGYTNVFGRAGDFAAQYFDGEMAEVNFVDGQALAPTAFGAYSTYNQWLPIKYAGTYGTNGFYLPFNSVSTSSYAGSFNGSTQYLTVAKNTLFEPTASQAWTLEAWVYPTSTTDAQIYFYGSPTVSTGNDIGVYAVLGNSSTFIGGGFYNGTTAYAVNTSILAPLNTWTHVAVVSTGSVLTVYGNGVSGGSVSTSLAPNAPALATARIGYYDTVTPRYFPGQISNARFVKGTAVYTANFVPPTAPLTAVTNTSLLTLQSATVVDNSGNSLAITNVNTVVTSVQSPFLNPTVLTADSSGNANNWTPNNISLTAGSTYDSLTDVPTLTSETVANYAVLNPLKNALTLSAANLNWAGISSSARNSIATMAVTSGKWYFETVLTASSSGNWGIGLTNDLNASTTAQLWNSLTGWALLSGSGGANLAKFHNSVNTTIYSASSSIGAVIGMAFDVDAGKIWFSRNGTYLEGVPSAGTGASYTDLTGTVQPYVYGYDSGDQGSINFGQRPFAYTAPSGFLPLNTFNI